MSYECPNCGSEHILKGDCYECGESVPVMEN